MTSAVIFDNSTLTAVQRLTGVAPAPRSYDVQGDYSALENFLANLFFNDDFYYIDDYKPEFRESRLTSFPYCRPIAVSAIPYEDLLSEAKRLTNNLMLDIRGGQVQPGLVKEFLESIGLHLTGAWQMASSTFYLTLKLLADGDNELRYKYSPLTALIFHQLTGRELIEPDSRCSMISSSGEIIFDGENFYHEDGKIESDLINFSNSLNWLTLRASFYTIVSSCLNASACLHPIRHNFIARWSSESNVVNTPDIWRRQIARYFGDAAASAINSINQVAEPEVIGINLPLFAVWAVGTAGNVSDAISFVLEVRQTPEACSLRQHLNELDALRTEAVAKFKTKLNRLVSALELETQKLQSRYGRWTSNQSAPSISLTAQVAPTPAFSGSLNMNLPNLPLRFGPPRHFRSLFRNVVDDVARFDNLGTIRKNILGQVRRSDTQTTPALPIENRKYFGRQADWKRSM